MRRRSYLILYTHVFCICSLVFLFSPYTKDIFLHYPEYRASPPQEPPAPDPEDPLAEPSSEPDSDLPPTDGVAYAKPVPKSKIRYPIPKRITLSHTEGFGDHANIGYGADYTTLGLFLAPDYFLGSFYPLVDLRAHRFDNDSYAASIGVGGRYIPKPNTFCEILGFNVFYDWRQGFLNKYNQLGIGIEVLGRWVDFRANGYFPVGAKKYKTACVYDDYTDGYYIINDRREITTYGFNMEVGWLAVDYGGFLFYTAAGPYYLTRQSNCFNFESIVGGKIRVRPQWKDYVACDASFSHDSAFNTIWELTFIVYLPLYQISNQNEKPCRLTDRQIYQPIERFETMPLGTRTGWNYNY